MLINQRAFNAFVTTDHRLFVNAGTIIESDTPNEVIGVLAHETGHIADDHVSSMSRQSGSDESLAHRHDPGRRRDGCGRPLAADRGGATIRR